MVFPHQLVTQSAQETFAVGKTFGALFLSKEGSVLPHIICCSGELGSGKTTFVQGFAQGLGIASRLLSPTFIIVRRYLISQQQRFFYHLDLYRIKDEKDILGVGFLDMVREPGAIIVIEWSERLGTLVPQKRFDASFAVQPDGNHTITFTKV